MSKGILGMITVHDQQGFLGMALLTVDIELSSRLHALRRDLQHTRR
jgi:hypothetical protein